MYTCVRSLALNTNIHSFIAVAAQHRKGCTHTSHRERSALLCAESDRPAKQSNCQNGSPGCCSGGAAAQRLAMFFCARLNPSMCTCCPFQWPLMKCPASAQRGLFYTLAILTSTVTSGLLAHCDPPFGTYVCCATAQPPASHHPCARAWQVQNHNCDSCICLLLLLH